MSDLRRVVVNTPGESKSHRKYLKAENARLREALHQIALASTGDQPLPMGKALAHVHCIARAALNPGEKP